MIIHGASAIKLMLTLYHLIRFQAQVGLLVILLIAMSDFVIGAFVGPLNDEVMGKGWIGLNCKSFYCNALEIFCLMLKRTRTFMY